MRLLTAALALAVALVPASAHAKVVSSARACDDDGCRTITARSTLRQMEGGAPATAPDTAASFHRVRMTVKGGAEEHAYTMVYVPSAGLMRFGGEGGGYEWLAATPRAQRGFERLVRGLEPLPARRLRGAGAEAPVAKTHKIVNGASFRDTGGGFPWLLPAVAGALIAAAAALRRRRQRLTAAASARTPGSIAGSAMRP